MTEIKKSEGVIAHLAKLTPIGISDDDKVRDKFIAMVESIHGAGTGQMVYQTERHYFQKQLLETPALQECTKFSLYGAFIDCAVQGLSFDPSRKLSYLMFDNHNIGTKDKPVFEKRARLAISPYGELFLRQKYGQIRSADNPEVVYEGEQFHKFSGKDGTIIEHHIKYPRPNTPLVAAYIRLVKSDGSVDYFIMDHKQMMRLKEYSAKKNKGYANELYGNNEKAMDMGFWIAKTVKHAFKSYPKVKLPGAHTVLETEITEDPLDGPDYGFTEETEPEQPTTKAAENNPAPEPEPEAKPEPNQPKERKLNF
jgi:recombinational DNA repair protein RecT